jgi:hypothetical protein
MRRSISLARQPGPLLPLDERAPSRTETATFALG